MDTYKVATVANSTSTMHKLTSKPITLECFEIDDYCSDIVLYDANDYQPVYTSEDAWRDAIVHCETLRQKYLETQDIRYWKELVRILPEGWLQKRTWTANYETIRAICSKGQRRNHKLNEWSGKHTTVEESFIQWARTLPYAQEFIFNDEITNEDN